MGSPVAYFEIISADADKLRGFYTDLFGWNAEPDPAMGGYAMVDTAADTAGAVGGGIGAADADTPAGIRLYLRVDDLESTLTEIERRGGRTVTAPADLPGDYGRFARFSDPDGNVVGLWA